jgi:hypothetical protein
MPRTERGVDRRGDRRAGFGVDAVSFRKTVCFWPGSRANAFSTFLSEQDSGNFVSVHAIGAMLASLAYTSYCKRFSVTQLVCLSIVMGVLATTGYWGLAGDRSAPVISFVDGFAYMTGMIIQLDLAARACVPETAGTTFAMLMFAGKFLGWEFDGSGGLCLRMVGGRRALSRRCSRADAFCCCRRVRGTLAVWPSFSETRIDRTRLQEDSRLNRRERVAWHAMEHSFRPSCKWEWLAVVITCLRRAVSVGRQKEYKGS